MKATSSAQYEATVAAAAAGEVSAAGVAPVRTLSTSASASAAPLPDTPPLEQVRANVWALPLAMPSTALPYILSYLVLDTNGSVHVIDAGWDSDENWQRVLAALTTLGRGPEHVQSLTLTHMHRDHVGMTWRYREATPARVQLSHIDQAAIRALSAGVGLAAGVDARHHPGAAELWGVPADRRHELDVEFNPEGDQVPIEADVLLDDGDRLDVPGTGIRVVSTPGHTNGSICLAFDDERLLVTGDHLLPAIFPGLGLGGPTQTNPVSDYVASLSKLAPFDDFEALPGHGYRFTGVAERRAESAEHHDSRTRATAAILAADPGATVWQIASKLHWSAGWQNLHGPYLRSALAQTAWHRERALGA